jgi:signal transduction histidine kinase
MQTSKKGQARVAARARLMLLLGEQLITDEVAAVSELVKNAYDADATKVIVTLFHVSEPDVGYIIIRDNGHGMSFETVISSWLELGTLSKARTADLKPRLSESGKRVCLGEKGLGRLAVHKLGNMTELVTRRTGKNLETRLTLDWTAFEQSEGFLEDIPVEWETTEPHVFTESDRASGTQITVKKIRRQWNAEMIERVQRNIQALKSPFADLSDFDITIAVEDKLAPTLIVPDIVDIVKRATYTFVGEIDDRGKIKYKYTFKRPDLTELNRERTDEKDIRNPEDFTSDRKPMCGPFSVRFYSWDLSPQDKKAVFGDTAIYTEMIQPNTGVKVFRDGFRVLPYGNPDNDWLSMDMERVRRFEFHISRNQIIGAIEISSKTAPSLLDKTDREGLIDNEAFRDFRSLVKSALAAFEAERYTDRHKLKEVTGRTRDEQSDRTLFSRNLIALSNLVTNQTQIDGETKLEIGKLISETRETLDSILSEKEQPLLVAASIGLTYMMPTHEVRRDLHEALKLLRSMSESKEVMPDKIVSVTSLLKQADSVVGGIGRLMQRTAEDEEFAPERAVKSSVELMRYRLERNSIGLEVEIRDSARVKGSDRLITILLLNFLDNSFYWLLRKKPEERKIKIVVDSYEDRSILVVSDSGPGFEDDDINVLTLPFFTRKPNGMGLGLYIADRIAKMSGGQLKILKQNELPGLLSGANIAVTLQKVTR